MKVSAGDESIGLIAAFILSSAAVSAAVARATRLRVVPPLHPFQRAFFPDPYVTDDQDCQEDQHFQQAKVTAIAEGLPLVRAANSGISAVVDPLGRIVGVLALGREGLLDSALPRPIPATIYARIGDIMFLMVVGAALFASLMTRIRK